MKACDPREVDYMLTTGRVNRAVVFDVETFDAFKAWQRELEAGLGMRLGNSAVLRMLVLAHGMPGTNRSAR
jgi:hypothetical protein